MRNLLLIVVVSVVCLADGQTELFSNAVKAGLSEPGLVTGTRPGGGFYSEVQSGNIATGASFRQWAFRLGDDFTVPAGGWMLSRVTVYGFQDNVQFPTVTFGSMEIHLNSVIGPVVATGNVHHSSWTDIYRIFNGQPNDVRRIQAVTYSINRQLNPGYYWVVYSANGNNDISGPWSPFLTVGGGLTVPGANAMGRQSSWILEWVTLKEPGSGVQLELPFKIDGFQMPVKIDPGDQQIQGPRVPPPTLFQQAFGPLMETQ